MAEEGLAPKEAVGLVLELTRPHISLPKASLRRIAKRLRREALKSLEKQRRGSWGW